MCTSPLDTMSRGAKAAELQSRYAGFVTARSAYGVRPERVGATRLFGITRHCAVAPSPRRRGSCQRRGTLSEAACKGRRNRFEDEIEPDTIAPCWLLGCRSRRVVPLLRADGGWRGPRSLPNLR